MTHGVPGGLWRLGVVALSVAGLTGRSQSPTRPSFSQPRAGGLVVRGEPYLITWVRGTRAHHVLKLFTGDETALFAVQTVNDTVDGASGQFVWLVPPDLQPGRYALGLGPRPAAGTSGLFEVVASFGTVPPARPGPLVLAG
ncbi:Ser-Thr-rich GPI-anchored membrane family protein [Kitasatospora brasiliensis]|uniref:Ser-Thr-rich GPI-anchored membrane family protein n=1 Tax=Kitasatospora brasiliensis TaxID=3058040 RepID=UPI00293031F5|nr:Ser-Thr-rich GPI-anchored membrane family protein [Kitasatospora sp. K002]